MLRMNAVKSICTLIAAAAVFSLIAGNVVAKENKRSGSGSYSTKSGKTGTYQRSSSGNAREGVERKQSITTQGGKTYERSATGNYNKETGEFSKTVTGPRGESRTYNGTAKDGERTGTYSTSTGKSGSFNSQIQRSEDGSVSKNQTITNQDGNSINRSVTGRYDKETGTVNRVITGPHGNEREAEVTITPDAR